VFFLEFLEERNVDFAAFPENKLRRPTYLFHGYLKQKIHAGLCHERVCILNTMLYSRWRKTLRGRFERSRVRRVRHASGHPAHERQTGFHAFNNDYAAMGSAGAFWNPKQEKFRIPDATDLTELDFALDSAGFTAMMLFKEKGPQRGMAGV
jgi:hypothetical protein